MKQLLSENQILEWKQDEERIKRIRQNLPITQKLQLVRREYERNITLPSKSIIVFSGDWHIGHEDSDAPLLEAHIELYNEYDMTVILMGDLIDNFNVKATFMKPSKATMSLKDQKETALDYLKDFKSQIAGIILGNHEERSLVTDEFDVADYWAKELQVNYLGRWGRLNITTPAKELSIFAAHKWFGNSLYNIFHPCVRARIQQPYLAGTADIVAVAHNHTAGISKTSNKMNIRSGAYVIQDDYSDRLGYMPQPNYVPAVVINEEQIIPFIDIYEAIDYYEQIKKGE